MLHEDMERALLAVQVSEDEGPRQAEQARALRSAAAGKEAVPAAAQAPVQPSADETGMPSMFYPI